MKKQIIYGILILIGLILLNLPFWVHLSPIIHLITSVISGLLLGIGLVKLIY